MRATVYQESRPGARLWIRPACGAAACLLALGLVACHEPSEPAPAAAPAPDPALQRQPGPPPKGRTIHFSRLTPFAPARLLDFQGEAPAASTARFGEVAVSEVERSYVRGEQRLKLRIVDTNINQRSKAPSPGEPFEDEERLGKPLLTGGAIGYVEFEKASGLARADLIVADRLLVSVSCENAESTAPVERFSSALDLKALARVVREETRTR